MKKLFGILFLSQLFFNSLHSQNTKPCSAPEANQFDFWVGDWELTWNDSLHGTNIVAREMNGCSIHEKFADKKNKFFGESWSMYNPTKKVWQQTWVDNSGSYLVLEGGMKGKDMELSMPQKDKNGNAVIMSMIFYNITANSFDWDWRKSGDNGKTWTSQWKIHYKRRIGFDMSRMKSYYFVMLKKGAKRDQDSITAAKIQDEHIKHLTKMNAEGKMSMAGPMMDDGDLRGICVYNVATKEEVIKLVNEDPAIISGRLIAEIHPWFAASGSCLPE